MKYPNTYDSILVLTILIIKIYVIITKILQIQ
jgi:hypothetical protein